MRYALIDSGIGLLGCAEALLGLDSDAELVLSYDSEGMPYGPRPIQDIVERSRALATVTLAHDPDVIVLACNTISVHALDAVRADHEPERPVVGTVPAIKPATGTGRPFAVWATVRTTGSRYQRDLIATFAPAVPVHEVACPGLAEAIEAADVGATAAAATVAAAATPASVRDIVLGCTHYPLAAPAIRTALGRAVQLYDAAPAVAAQSVRRGRPFAADRSPASGGQRLLAVFDGGRRVALPARATAYPAGRLLAQLEHQPLRG